LHDDPGAADFVLLRDDQQPLSQYLGDEQEVDADR
jgi:hypothetical protein